MLVNALFKPGREIAVSQSLKFGRYFLHLCIIILTTACGGSGSQSESGESSSAENEDEVERRVILARSKCDTLIEGPPVGLACLHCGHPSAREQSMRLAEIMQRSCRRHIATTMLVDGTFSDDRDWLGDLVRVMTEGGSTLHLYLYLGNGPWQRRYSSIPDRGFGSKIPPKEFRKRILSDAQLREKYRSRIRWVEPLMSYASSRGAVVSLIPMLEDNLDAKSARVLEQLTVQTVLPSLVYALGRNPCPGCYSGNDSSIPEGLFEDQHAHSGREGIRPYGGLVTNDGKGFSFPFEQRANAMSFAEMSEMKARAQERNNSFVIWTKHYQGLDEENTFYDPDSRHYLMPTAAEEEALLLLLR